MIKIIDYSYSPKITKIIKSLFKILIDLSLIIIHNNHITAT